MCTLQKKRLRESPTSSPLKKARLIPQPQQSRPATGVAVPTAAQINKMTVPKIRHQLKQAGLSTIGDRETLVDRLTDYYYQ